jgi:preprotein translocase subunit SecG
MTTIILVLHLFIAIGLVGLVLVQRSEGGALGIGGGGGGFMTGRGAANLLTRMTAILAAAFFCTSILLTVLARQGSAPTSILDQGGSGQQNAPAENGGSALPKLAPIQPQAPAPAAPAVPAAPSGPQVPRSQ